MVPLLENVLATSPPLAIDSLNDRVIICTDTPRGEAPIAKLGPEAIGYAIVEPDRERATDLHEAGHTVIHGDPESTETLHTAGIDTAIGEIAGVFDEINAGLTLAARDATDVVRVFTLAEEATTPTRTFAHKPKQRSLRLSAVMTVERNADVITRITPSVTVQSDDDRISVCYSIK